MEGGGENLTSVLIHVNTWVCDLFAMMIFGGGGGVMDIYFKIYRP